MGWARVDDPRLVEYLVEHHLALEVCLTSNIAPGVYWSLAEHPVAQLHVAGVRVTITTDTPAIFEITLSGEATLLASHFGLSRSAIQQILPTSDFSRMWRTECHQLQQSMRTPRKEDLKDARLPFGRWRVERAV